MDLAAEGLGDVGLVFGPQAVGDIMEQSGSVGVGELGFRPCNCRFRFSVGVQAFGGVGVGVGVAAFSVGQALWDDSMRKVGKTSDCNSAALNPKP